MRKGCRFALDRFLPNKKERQCDTISNDLISPHFLGTKTFNLLKREQKQNSGLLLPECLLEADKSTGRIGRYKHSVVHVTHPGTCATDKVKAVACS
ncbi:hypothetical protein CDAR_237561 [Caerostris darwini]|uniref:Uncharacterized protein n=1 Tax=Caerostris darwini TaxID=1538125 RepID=A0AAV4NEH7_9ARAC|nr:hypothetical protein CDAR_237561 [Caerostris darwini]